MPDPARYHKEYSTRSALVQWYALYLRSRCEKKVYAELQKKCIECFLPMVEEMRVWSDRKRKVLVPLFPGYLLVRIDLLRSIDVLQSHAVVRFVGIRGRPSPIPEEQVNWIRIVIGYPAAIRREAHYHKVGARVRVVAGPFKGIQGVVTRLKGSIRVVISLDVITQAVSVEVAPEFLEQFGSVHQA